MEGKKYKQYLRNPEMPIPATTLWRLQRQSKKSMKESQEDLSHSSFTDSLPPIKRRKLYHRHPLHSVPRQTAHNWTKKEYTSLGGCDSSSSCGNDTQTHLKLPSRKKTDNDACSHTFLYSAQGVSDLEGGEHEQSGSESEGDLVDISEHAQSGSENEGDLVDISKHAQSGSESEGGLEDMSEYAKIGPESEGDLGDIGEHDSEGEGDLEDISESVQSGLEGEEDVGSFEEHEQSDSESEEELGDIGEHGSEGEEDVGFFGDYTHSSSEGASEDEAITEDEGSDDDGLKILSTDPLYPGAPLSMRASWLSIYQFAISNRLTDSATKQLLELVRIHCPSSSSCPPSLYKLKKQLGCMCNSIKILNFCSICMEEVLNSSSSKQCPKRECRKKKSQLCYFSALPFEKHLQDIFTENWDAAQYPFTRQYIPGVIQDIQDGKKYQKLMRTGEFLSVPEHTGLILCSDGVPLFKSSGQSFWPIQMSITSLPPHIRMNVAYLLLGGIWLGPVKPDMKVILEPILEKIDNLDISIKLPEGTKHLKAKLLLGVFDLPAKAMALNFIQFNGKHGCAYCLDEGTYSNHRRLYLPSDTHDPRKKRDLHKWAKKAERKKIPVFGVKGTSILSPYINIIKDVPVDYMHAVLEGVTKSLFNFWFESKYHGKRFYLGRQVDEIDSCLLRIKPPHEFRRTPRSVRTSKYWKASEYRAWLLFYSLPILSNFLPLDYVMHLSLLVSSMHILLGTSISASDLETTKLILIRFYELIPHLYPENLCSSNAHSLIHLCEFVSRWGPLWCYSTFGFENLNGYLKKHSHGTRNVLPQMIQAVRLRQTLPLLQKVLETQENGATIAFLEHVSGQQRQNHTGSLGRVVHKALSDKQVTALQQADFQVTTTTLPVFPRYKINGVTFSSSKQCKLRNSSICQIKIQSSHEICFGSIGAFCFTGGVPAVLVSVFESTENCVIGESRSRSVLQPDDCRAAKCVELFIFKVKKISISNRLVAIPPENIIRKCVHIPLKHSPTDFIVTLPNYFENH